MLEVHVKQASSVDISLTPKTEIMWIRTYGLPLQHESQDLDTNGN